MEVEIAIKAFEKEFGKKFITDNKILEEESRAPYLVSPILSKMGKKVIGVIMAEDEDDISNAVRLCDIYRIPLLARGAGTSTIGQVLPISPSTIVLDINKMKEVIELDDNWVRVTPSVKVLKALQYLRKRGKELRVYPSSFYISTLGGYIAGGDVGIGSFQYGYHFDNGGINSIKVIGPTGKYELKGKDTLAIAQAAGTTGIISSAELAIVDYEDWKDQLITFNDVEEVSKYLKKMGEYRDKIRRITIEDKGALSLVAKDRLDKIGEWNVIVASTLSLGEEVNMRFLDELAFAAIYVTMSRLTSFKEYF
ncbi:FAD-linked oxidase, partial [Sulfolobus sp. D5]